MFHQSRQGCFEATNDGFTKCNVVCSWVCLSLSALVFFGSLILIVLIVSYNYPMKWTFTIYIGASGILFLLSILSNALIISTKQKFSSEGRSVSIASSIPNRVIESLGNQHAFIPETLGVCNQEVQTLDVTPPPPYEDLSNGSTDVNQLTSTDIQEASLPEDVKLLLTKILYAINNSRALINEQPSQRTQEPKCNRCKTQTPESEASAGLQLNKNVQTPSESEMYPQLPEEVLEQFADPDAFIRALAKYQSQNRIKQCKENRKTMQVESGTNQLENKETFCTKNVQNPVVLSLEDSDQVSNKQTNTIIAHNESLKPPSQNVQRRSPIRPKLEGKSGNSSKQECNYIRPSTSFQDLGLPSPKRYLSSDDGLRAQADPSSQNPRNSLQDVTLPHLKEVSQQSCSSRSARIFKQNATRNGTKISLQDHSLKTKRDLCSKNLTSQRELSSNISQDFNSKSSKIFQQDINSANLIGIPLKDFRWKTSPQISGNVKSGNPAERDGLKSEDINSWKQLEHGHTFSIPNKPLNLMKPTSVLYPHNITSTVMQHQHATQFASESFFLDQKDVPKFSTESVDCENMNREDWFAAWNRAVSKISPRNSTFNGARL